MIDNPRERTLTIAKVFQMIKCSLIQAYIYKNIYSFIPLFFLFIDQPMKAKHSTSFNWGYKDSRKSDAHSQETTRPVEKTVCIAQKQIHPSKLTPAFKSREMQRERSGFAQVKTS